MEKETVVEKVEKPVVVEKERQIQWELANDCLRVKNESPEFSIDLSKIKVYQEMDEIEKYCFVFGIKQTVVDKVSAIVSRAEKLKVVKERIELFKNKDLEYLPTGRKGKVALTPEEKAEILESNTQFLIEQGLPAETAKLVAKATGTKRLKFDV